ncbi:hypothetical protein RMATCC62417_18845 [Rhizopus microsporus]|nr:hypothetical protein RMATCC62417_18845 [Rhizopus microsporus]
MKIKVLIKKECPFCDKGFVSYHKFRDHLYLMHKYVFQSKSKSQQAKNARVYNDENLSKFPEATIAYGCPSCVEYFQEKGALGEHFFDMGHIIADNSEESDVGDNRWVLNGNDISSKFFAYRAECIAKKDIQEYNVIDGLEQVLAISNILLLRSATTDIPMNTAFCRDLQTELYKNILERIGKMNTLSNECFSRIKKALNKFSNNTWNLDRVRAKLLRYASKCTTQEVYVYRVIEAV